MYLTPVRVTLREDLNAKKIHTLLTICLWRTQGPVLYPAPMPDDLSITLRTWRLAQALTQGQLARRLGVARTMVCRWESGRTVPAPRSLERLAEVLEVPLADLQALVPARESRCSRRRRVERALPRRPLYPIGASVDQMLRVGGCAHPLRFDVTKRLSADDLRVVDHEFPRDTRWELLVVHHVLKARTRLVECSLDRLRCPILVLDDFERAAGAFQRQHALLWEGEDERMLIFGQVRIRVAGTKPYRVDFLIWYKRRGLRGEWVFLEIDGSQHKSTPNLDAARAEGIGIPEIRHDNVQTLSPWYFQLLVRDVRRQAAIAAEWTRDRKRQARAARRRRTSEAEQCLLAA